MPIEQHQGGTMITGEGIPLFRLFTMKQAIKLEQKGMKSSRFNATKIAMIELCGYSQKDRVTTKRRTEALKAVEEAIAQQKRRVEREHDLNNLPQNWAGSPQTTNKSTGVANYPCAFIMHTANPTAIVTISWFIINKVDMLWDDWLNISAEDCKSGQNVRNFTEYKGTNDRQSPRIDSPGK